MGPSGKHDGGGHGIILAECGRWARGGARLIKRILTVDSGEKKNVEKRDIQEETKKTSWEIR